MGKMFTLLVSNQCYQVTNCSKFELSRNQLNQKADIGNQTVKFGSTEMLFVIFNTGVKCVKIKTTYRQS